MANVVKWQKFPRERLERLIITVRYSGMTPANQERYLDFVIARWEWANAFGRMWRYIGQHASGISKTLAP